MSKLISFILICGIMFSSFPFALVPVSVAQDSGNLSLFFDSTYPLNAPKSYTKDGITNNLSYDESGNLKTLANGNQLSYDQDNRLVEVKDSQGNILAQYTYDYTGQRIKTIEHTAEGTKTTYYHLPGIEIEILGGTTTITKYLGSGGIQKLVYQTTDPTIPNTTPTTNNLYQTYQDHLSSTKLITDLRGVKLDGGEIDYYPYGQQRLGGEPNSLPTTRLYTSQINDYSTGLYYYNARYYDPTLGIFTSPDQAQGPNRYSYVGGNPIMRNDPSGNFGIGQWLSGIGKKIETAYLSMLAQQLLYSQYQGAVKDDNNEQAKAFYEAYSDISRETADEQRWVAARGMLLMGIGANSLALPAYGIPMMDLYSNEVESNTQARQKYLMKVAELGTLNFALAKGFAIAVNRVMNPLVAKAIKSTSFYKSRLTVLQNPQYSNYVKDTADKIRGLSENEADDIIRWSISIGEKNFRPGTLGVQDQLGICWNTERYYSDVLRTAGVRNITTGALLGHTYTLNYKTGFVYDAFVKMGMGMAPVWVRIWNEEALGFYVEYNTAVAAEE